MGVSSVTQANGNIEYKSTHRSIFDMDTSIAQDWNKEKDHIYDSTHLVTIKVLKTYGTNFTTHTLFRQWYIASLVSLKIMRY